jgi:type IV pilus assembly protein PilW
MISIAIGLVILAALIALLANTSRTNREIAKANSLIENGRIAIQLLQNDLVHGGYWSTHVPRFDDLIATGVPDDVPVDLVAEPPDPCLAFDPANWDENYINSILAIPVQAYDAAVVCAGVITDRLDNTDVLVTRHADTCPPGTGECAVDAVGQLYVQASLCPDDLERAVVDTAGFTLRQRDCTTVAEKRRFVSNIYYVRRFAVTDGDGVPTLVRSQFDLAGGVLEHQPATPMVEGIESFRVELGLDSLSETGEAVDFGAAPLWADPTMHKTLRNRGDGVPDGDFVRCTTATPCLVGDLMNTVAVRIHVLARSREQTRSSTDDKTYVLGSAPSVCPTSSTDAGCALKTLDPAIKRHLFTTTVRLPNISGRRETPL